MRRGSEWLSKGAEILAAREDEGDVAEFDLVIVGSGYGGAVAAARIAQHFLQRDAKPGSARPFTIALLERGLEYLPGDFPRTTDELAGHVRWSGGKSAGVHGLRDGLFDIRVGDDVSALLANGLGGGSLINAGVAARADPATLADKAWPAPWRADHALWGRLYARATGRLGAKPWAGRGRGKADAMDALAASLGQGRAEPVSLTVHLPNHEAPDEMPPEHGCVGCGDCFTGCNIGAKRTLGTSYLRDAARAGVQIFTGATVLSVSRTRDSANAPRPGHATAPRWTVHWAFSDPKRLPARDSSTPQDADPGAPRRRTPMHEKSFRLRAHRVILSAGTFGSTEILTRSTQSGLRFSAQLGCGFSSNGDIIGAQYGLDKEVLSYADVAVPRAQRRVGPTITRMIEIERGNRADPSRRVVIQDLTAPAALQWFYGELMTSLMIPQRWVKGDWRVRDARTPDPANVDDVARGVGDLPGALDRTLLLSAFGHDGAAGKLQPLPGFDETMHDGNLVVHWPGAGQAASFRVADRLLCDATEAVGATWLRDPMWQAEPDTPLIAPPTQRSLLTVHPLGGCAMALSMADGVVDPYGRVFDAGGCERTDDELTRREDATREDRRLHDGLFVLDGSIMPTSLGINPLLTITALAEGIVDAWLPDWDAEADDPTLTTPASTLRPAPTEPALAPWPAVAADEAWPATTAAVPTRISFEERMSGLLAPALQPADRPSPLPWNLPASQALFRVSLKFTFDEIPDVQEFVRRQQKTLGFTVHVALCATWWDDVHQRQADAPAGAAARCDATGQVTWFEQQRTCVLPRMWRTLRTWWTERRPADLPRIEADGSDSPSFLLPGSWKAFCDNVARLVAFVKMLTQFGAPRLLAYRFDPLPSALSGTTPDGKSFTLPAGTTLSGAKALVYTPGGNPWDQLTRMQLHACPPGGTRSELAHLLYDDLYAMSRDDLPLQIVEQHDAITGLRDVTSLLLYAARVMFAQQYLRFRKPDYALYRALLRLPGVASPDRGVRAGDQRPSHLFDKIDVYLPPTADRPETIRLCLTRVRATSPSRPARGAPIVMLHGFGSGGVQFTHASIEHPMAQWMASQGRDVWVGELRTSIGLPTCQQQWSMDDVAREDIAALVDEVCHRAGASQVDVIAHCIGSAMFCMAALGGALGAGGKSKIRRAALMQVGPIMHLPRLNRLRAYLGNRAQRVLQAGFVDASVDDSANATMTMFDRLLGTLRLQAGYSTTQWQGRESETSPGLQLSDDLRHNGRLVNVLRSAGVFGQLFQWKNMLPSPSKERDPERVDGLLQALPDMLGPCNLTTYLQTAQYTFERRLTDDSGDNAYVTDANVRENFAFPVLFIQGSLNDVFAPRGTFESFELLKRVHGAQHDVSRIVIEGYGHLDCVVGYGIADKIYAPMLHFLDQPTPPTVAAPAAAPPAQAGAFRAPCIGPWLGHVFRSGDGWILRTALKVDDLRMPSDTVYSVIAVGGVARPQTLQRHTVAPAATGAVVAAWRTGEVVIDVHAPALFMQATFEVWFATNDAADASDAAGFCARWTAQRPPGGTVARVGVDCPIDSLLLDDRWLDLLRRDTTLDGAEFVLACCRQAPMLIDRPRADAALRSLAASLGAAPIRHVLLVGDQVYADALSLGGTPTMSRLRFVDAYREAWTSSQREAMRRVPCYMIGDDHEFSDDYGNVQEVDRPRDWRSALDAMKRYEYAATPLGASVLPPAMRQLWYHWEAAGIQTFMCDTRSTRVDGRRVDATDAKIITDAQFDAIGDWLRATRATGQARVLVMSTPPAPVFADAASRDEYRRRCDDWQRFPASRQRLFDLLLADGAERLVILSGDYHCFAATEVRISGGASDARSVTFPVIVTTGLYSPYLFVNTALDELWPGGPAVPLRCGDHAWTYRLVAYSDVNGYTRIAMRRDGRFTATLMTTAGAVATAVAWDGRALAPLGSADPPR